MAKPSYLLLMWCDSKLSLMTEAGVTTSDKRLAGFIDGSMTL
ncbi:MAG TPA: hypothetical protein VN089_27500 [Duganella sp.]|nr:hypothetical protein [Duganella sp.]